MVKVQVDKEDESAHQNATVAGGLRTGGLGLSTALLLSVAAQRTARFPAYNALTFPLKAFAVTAITTATFIIGADAASRKFELAKYAIGSGTKLEADAYRAAEAEKMAGISEEGRAPIDLRTLSTRDAVVEWSKAHRYSVVFAGWATSMVGSFAYISMTPLTFSQKLVQSRMVAQGLTVAVLIASAGLNQIPTAAGGENEEEEERVIRENATYRFKKGSPHDIASHHAADLLKAEQSHPTST